jgi:hypothetical protein
MEVAQDWRFPKYGTRDEIGKNVGIGVSSNLHARSKNPKSKIDFKVLG